MDVNHTLNLGNKLPHSVTIGTVRMDMALFEFESEIKINIPRFQTRDVFCLLSHMVGARGVEPPNLMCVISEAK